MVKFSADALFDGYRFLEKDAVLILEDDGRVSAIVPASEAGPDIRHLPGILCPGFINCHCHLELSHLKGRIPKGGGLVPFLLGILKERNDFPEEEILDAMEAAEAMMLANGIVAAGDIANTVHTLPLKQRGRIRYHTFVEVMGVTEPAAEDRFSAARRIYDAFLAAAGDVASLGRPPVSIVPHAPYSVSKSLFGLIDRFPGNTLLSIHNQESADEDALFRYKSGRFLDLYRELGIDASFFRPTGLSSLQSWLPGLQRPVKLLLVHDTFTTAEDLAFAADAPHELFMCLCPNANVYIEGCLPDISLFRRRQAMIVTGTDSLASNQGLSVLEELKTIRRYYPDIPDEALLKWSTSNGARALGMQQELGSFEKGKSPGVLLLSGNGRLTGQSTVSLVMPA